MIQTDEWKKTDDYSNYRIYKDGRVYSEKRKIFLKPGLNSHGYLTCVLSNDTNKKPKSMKIHRLVGLVHIPNPDDKEMIDHIDRNKLNNNVANLRWVSRSVNCINKSVSGTIPYRHIGYHKTNKCFAIRIKRNKKYIFQKAMSANKYTLQDVVKVRNELYQILGIEIDD
jgi:hypothetical protein